MLVVGSVAASAMVSSLAATRGVNALGQVTAPSRFGPSQPESPGSTSSVTPVQRTEFSGQQVSFTNPALITTLQEGSESQNTRPENELTSEELKQLDKLKKRDAEVRRHEAAHKAAGGALASNPTYTFQTGPDGKQYAIGGEVKIDSSPVEGDPQATIAKMDIVIRAALAPEEPSAQDKRVASKAQQTKLQAQQELAKQQQEERNPELTEDAQQTKSFTDQPQGLPLSQPFDNTQNDEENTPNNSQFSQASAAYGRSGQASIFAGTIQSNTQNSASLVNIAA